MTNKEIVQALRCSATKEEQKSCDMCQRSERGCFECINSYLYEAVSLIEQMTAENAALREKQRWIPVTERMPEELILVNVVWVNRAPESYYGKIKDVSFSGTACFYRENWYWDSPVVLDLLAEYGKDDPDLVDDAVEITHWMPLPHAPKGDAK